MANNKIIPVVDALKKLYEAIGGTPEAVEDISTTAEMLKQLYEAMGGTPKDVEDLSTTTELIQALADVATPGGGGGSSDFSIAKVTLANNNGSRPIIPNLFVYSEYNIEGSVGEIMTPQDEIDVILYKGKCYLEASTDDFESVSGAIEFNEDFGMYIITGDCTITFKEIIF